MSYHHLLVSLCVGYSKEEVRKAVILDPEYSQTGAFMQIPCQQKSGSDLTCSCLWNIPNHWSSDPSWALLDSHVFKIFLYIKSKSIPLYILPWVLGNLVTLPCDCSFKYLKIAIMCFPSLFFSRLNIINYFNHSFTRHDFWSFSHIVDLLNIFSYFISVLCIGGI